jgi:drug/metabolite transporter (DMT)-like permease
MESIGKKTQSQKKGFLFITIAVLGWGLSTSFIESGLKYADVLPFLAMRFILATTALLPWVTVFKRKEVIELLTKKLVWIIGLSEAAGLIFQYFGQNYVFAGLAALLSLLFLIFVPFLDRAILKERIRIVNLIAALLGFIGAGFIAFDGKWNNFNASSAMGTILLLLAALSYGLYITTTSKLTKYVKKDVDTFSLFFNVLLIISLTTTIGTVASGKSLAIDRNAWIWLIGLVVFSTLIAFFAYFEALKVISAGTAAIILLLQILVPFFIDLVILRRSYSLWMWAGVLIILVAMIMAILNEINENQNIQ